MAFPQIVKNRTARVQSTKGGSYTYKYADINDVLDAVIPILTENGITMIQPISVIDGVTYLETVLCCGENKIKSVMILNIANQAPQQVGALLTYYRRYALTSLLGIATEESEDEAAEDTPGKKNKGQQFNGPLTITELQKAMRAFAGDLARVTDADELSGLLLSSEPILSQCRRDLQAWYYGQEGSDQLGAAHAIEEKRKELQGE